MTLFKKKEKEFRDIEPKEAFTILEKHRDDNNYVLLDIRTPKEYNEGHIENAHLLDIKSSDFEEKLKNMDKDKEYIIYCKSGMRSDKASKIMTKHGFKNVTNIIGGINKWKSKRLPIEK